MRNFLAIFKRELTGYFITPVAYVFIVIFLFLTGIFTFHLGGFFERNSADLRETFFVFHPWLYLFLVPAITMRLWSEERKQGTIELLMTLPITLGQAVVAKFCAAWAFAGIALLGTFPIWITVNYLGDPDNGVILASYLGSLLMAGGFLAIGSCISAISKNQVISFVVTVVVCLLFVLAGYPAVTDMLESWAPQSLVNTVSRFSFLTNFQDIMRGVIDLRNVVYFISLIGCFLFANVIVVDLKKAD